LGDTRITANASRGQYRRKEEQMIFENLTKDQLVEILSGIKFEVDTKLFDTVK